MNKIAWIIAGVVVVILIGAGIWYYLALSSANYGTQYSPNTNPVATTTTTIATTTVSTHPVAGPDQHCGGNMVNSPVCGTGYDCQPVAGSHLPVGDVGGVCVSTTVQGPDGLY